MLKWINTEDIYEALNPSFIEEVRLRKMSSNLKDKGKAVVDEVEEEENVHEEQFQRDLLQAKMISRLQTTFLEGEPSRRTDDDAKDGLYEEELLYFEPSPSHTHTVLASEFEEGERSEEEIIYGLVVGLKEIRGEKEAHVGPLVE